MKTRKKYTLSLSKGKNSEHVLEQKSFWKLCRFSKDPVTHIFSTANQIDKVEVILK